MPDIICRKKYKKIYIAISGDKILIKPQKEYCYCYKFIRKLEILEEAKFNRENRIFKKVLNKDYGMSNLSKAYDAFIRIYRIAQNLIKNLKIVDFKFDIKIHSLSREMLFLDLNFKEFFKIMRYELYLSYKLFNVDKYLFYDGLLSDIYNNDFWKLPCQMYNDILLFYFDEIRNKITNEKYKCILSPIFTALTVHEVFGHTFENKNSFDKEIPYNPILNIKDVVKDENLPIPLDYDHYGNKTNNIDLVSNGSFVSNLVDNLTLSGTGRIGFSDSNIFNGMVRMRNTCLTEGNDKFSDMLSSIENGIYLYTPGIGFADKNGNFAIEVLNAAFIRRGEIKSNIRTPFIIKSNLFDFIKNIKMIDSSFKWFGGTCIKKNTELLVGMGGANVLACIDVNI